MKRIDRKALKLTPKELRAVQMIMLEMLIEVDRICRKCGIHYSLGCGTLLGAVREGGFIPWDDDADVIMLRDEYERFCKVCGSELDTERFFLQTWDTDPEYRIGFAKMRRNGTVYVRAGQERMRYRGGVFSSISCRSTMCRTAAADRKSRFCLNAGFTGR